jgi:hypothetical protein
VGGTGVMFVCDLSDPDGGAPRSSSARNTLGAPIDIW